MSYNLLLLTLLTTLTLSLPYADQMTLANSLIVGNNNDLALWTCKVCDDSNRPLHSHIIQQTVLDIKCILSVYPQFAVLAFRYTNTLLNVWQDILYPFQVKDENTCPKCKVQKAYNKMWDKIRTNVTNDLIEIRRQTNLTKLYVTGISLGGGLAGLAYIDISYVHIFDEVRVVTYGAPRVGNKHWASFFDAATQGRSRRFIVKGDPIVVLPACLTPLCSYRQTGIKVVCYEKEQVCRQEKEVEVEDLIGQGLGESVKKVRENFEEMDSDIKNMRSIMDHVNGYPKIYNFTLILNQ